MLGPPWAGLHFPSWDSLYAMLDRSEHGPECRARLVELGAPANGVAADAPVAGPKEGGTPTKFVGLSTGGTDRKVARLKRDHPDLADDVIAGRLSAHAAAVQAGIRRPTWTAPADPERLAQAIERKFPGWPLQPVHAADTHRQPVQTQAPQQQAAPQPQPTCVPYVPALDHAQSSHG